MRSSTLDQRVYANLNLEDVEVSGMRDDELAVLRGSCIYMSCFTLMSMKVLDSTSIEHQK